MSYCDDYLELVKGRFWEESDWTESDRKAAQATLYETFRTLLGLFAPFLPYITEEIYQKAACFGEDAKSLHATSWPSRGTDTWIFERTSDMNVLRAVLYAVRKLRSDNKIGAGTLLQTVFVQIPPNAATKKDDLHALRPSLRSAARSSRISFEPSADLAFEPCGFEGLAVAVETYPEGAAPKMTTSIQMVA